MLRLQRLRMRLLDGWGDEDGAGSDEAVFSLQIPPVATDICYGLFENLRKSNPEYVSGPIPLRLMAQPLVLCPVYQPVFP